MSGRTLEVFCDDARYPAMTDAQLSECIATIRAFSQGQPVRLESESWFGNFRRLLPMYWKYKQDAEYWKSWQDPDKIKRLEAENADLLAIAQGQREDLGATKRALRIACEDLLVKSERIKLFEGRITSLATLPEEEFDAACGPENGTQVQFGIRAGFVAGWKYSVQKLIGTKK